MSEEKCPVSPTGKHKYVHFRCIWCGKWAPGTVKSRYRFLRKMTEQYGVLGVVEVEKDGRRYLVPKAVAKAFNMKIVKEVPEEKLVE